MRHNFPAAHTGRVPGHTGSPGHRNCGVVQFQYSPPAQACGFREHSSARSLQPRCPAPKRAFQEFSSGAKIEGMVSIRQTKPAVAMCAFSIFFSNTHEPGSKFPKLLVKLNSRCSVQTICNSLPFTAFRHTLNNNQLRSRFVAAVEFGVNRAGKSLRVMGNDADTLKPFSRRNNRMSNDLTPGQGFVSTKHLAAQIAIIAPVKRDQFRFGGVMPGQHAWTLQRAARGSFWTGQLTDHSGQGLLMNNSGPQDRGG